MYIDPACRQLLLTHAVVQPSRAAAVCGVRESYHHLVLSIGSSAKIP
jgi:hypothetical protein